jgi:EAL domain-containing protein (putative c-di-GMP-specific phosphodiesterase class I)
LRSSRQNVASRRPAACSVAAAGLELEITESLIMEDVEHSIAILEAIRAMGVSIAIDDYGTGFSSLGYLSKLPVDTLKIDCSFVNDMTADPAGAGAGVRHHQLGAFAKARGGSGAQHCVFTALQHGRSQCATLRQAAGQTCSRY